MIRQPWKTVCIKETTSTNDEAHRFCDKSGRFVVVRALRQTAGRGRRGRLWQSMEGNLFYSLVLEFDLEKVGWLVIISALSMYESIKQLISEADVACKWPNDILLNGKKVSGILLEKGEGNYMIVGIGVNIMQAPENPNLSYDATSLCREGGTVTPEDFLDIYLQKFDAYLENLQKNGFNDIKQKWLSHAYKLGKEIMIKQDDKEENGFFAGIDDSANLLLRQSKGIKKIFAGEVFYIEK